MAAHVAEFVDSVRDLPAELQRCFALVGELDQKSQAAKEDVELKIKQQIEGHKQKVKNRDG
jgi:hypothetical protein